MEEQKQAPILLSFPKTFWIANVMELFERAAYYGLNSLLAIYLTNAVKDGGLGFTELSVGFLQSVVYAMTYIVPILGGALADRYGYRRMLLVAFSLLAFGYFASGHMSTYGLVFISLLVMATGSGLFKPVISGTIARTTTEKTSGFGFGVYYWMINLGAFLAPIFAGYLKSFSWRYVFMASALYCAAMLIPTIFIYKDPPKPESKSNLKQVLGSAAMVLGDARFMLMIVLYSCFWILYFQNFGSVLWFLRDFIDKTPVNNFFDSLGITLRFDAYWVTSINAGTIILLQVFVSRIVQHQKALNTIISGIIVGSLGFVILAFASNAWVFIVAIAVFSIGEMTVHPKYYSYIGNVAPHDKKAVYMGYAFLYGVIGSLVGSSLGGALYESTLKPLVGMSGVQSQLRNFWLIFAGLGVVAMFGLIFYNRFFAEDTPTSRKLARTIMIGIYTLLLITGGLFFYHSVFDTKTVQYKIMFQSLIMLLIGMGGLIISSRSKNG